MLSGWVTVLELNYLMNIVISEKRFHDLCRHIISQLQFYSVRKITPWFKFRQPCDTTSEYIPNASNVTKILYNSDETLINIRSI